MKQGALLCSLGIMSLLAAQAKAQTLHTPKAGSAERQAICDGARVFVLSKYASRALPQPIVFKINHLAVQGDYCNFEAIPLFKDGSYISPEDMIDIAFNLCLRKVGGGWQVIADLSRTDVPDPLEVAAIKRKLSSDFPLALLSANWRHLLRGASGGR